MKVNFYWSGENWKFIYRLAIVSHIRVGHEVIMWVNKMSSNNYWIDDLPVQICDAKKYIDTDGMLKNGWNLRTISTMFQYNIMDKTGEYTADCDAIAINHWPDDSLILCSEGNRYVSSVGVLRVPAGHGVLKCAKNQAKKDWGNVKIFSQCCINHKLKSTHKTRDFYPVTFKKGKAAKTILSDGKIPKCYSYHVFTNNPIGRSINHTMLEDDKYKNSILKKISLWAFGDEFFYTRRKNDTM